MAEPVKKRRRTPFSCTACRNKKVKCDRSKPNCIRCLKSEVQCAYTSPAPWLKTAGEKALKMVANANANGYTNAAFFISSIDMPPHKSSTDVKPVESGDIKAIENQTMIAKLEEIAKLQNQIDTIKASFNTEVDCISLVMDYDDSNLASFTSKKNIRFVSLGTFTTPSVWRRDPLMQNFVKTLFLTNNVAIKTASNGAETVAEKYYPKSHKISKIPDLQRFDFLNSQVKFKKGQHIYNDTDDLVRSIETILPPKEVIDSHIDHFMSFIHPFIPVIDEPIFHLNMSNILCTNPLKVDRVEIKISSKLDLARIALLILILRLSYLSIYLQSDKMDSSYTKHESTLQYPINSNVINYVHSILTKLNFTRKTSIETYQVMLLLKFYQSHACEDGDGYFGENGTIYCGLICASSRLIGLHKDFQDSLGPTGVSHKPNNANRYQMSPHLEINLLRRGTKPFIQLWKKLWQLTLEFDLLQAVKDGSSPLLDHDGEDCRGKIIEIDASCSNSLNLKSETFTITRMNNFSLIDFKLASLMSRLHDTKSKPTINEIDELLADIQSISDSVYGAAMPSNLSSEELDIYEVNNLKSKLEISGSLLIIEYNLLLHVEHLGRNQETKQRGIERFQKLFSGIATHWITVIDMTISCWERIYPNSTQGAKQSKTYRSYIIILAPVVFDIYSKLMLVLFYLSIRVLVLTRWLKKKEPGSVEETQFKVLYSHLINMMKGLAMTQESMSEHWYISLRNYATFKNLIEWFESGGEFAIDKSESNDNTHSRLDSMNNPYAEEVIVEYLLSIHPSTINSINSKLEEVSGKHDLGKYNSKNNDKFERDPTVDSLNIEPIGSLNISHDAENIRNNDIFELLQPIDLGDWDAVTDWFNQPYLFNPSDVFSFDN